MMKRGLISMYRAGIIGYGFAGATSPDSHYKAYHCCQNTSLAAVSDIKFAMPHLWHWGGHDFFRDYREMIKSIRLDIVSVCTPVETHCQIVCDIAPYVKAINCEKPIATTIEEADRMIETCHKNSVILQVNHQRRFEKPRMRWSRGLLNNGSHAFDLIRQIGAVGKVEMVYVDTDDYIFELDVFSDPKPLRLTLRGVEHLVECLKEGKQSISSGEEARLTLSAVLQYKEYQCQ